VPTLVVGCAYDQIVTRTHDLCDRIPDATCREINAGHQAYFEASEEFAPSSRRLRTGCTRQSAFVLGFIRMAPASMGLDLEASGRCRLAGLRGSSRSGGEGECCCGWWIPRRTDPRCIEREDEVGVEPGGSAVLC
jgi:hypothetical protein